MNKIKLNSASYSSLYIRSSQNISLSLQERVNHPSFKNRGTTDKQHYLSNIRPFEHDEHVYRQEYDRSTANFAQTIANVR